MASDSIILNVDWAQVTCVCAQCPWAGAAQLSSGLLVQVLLLAGCYTHHLYY